MKISIIVPIYNVEEYLPKCIESIISQTHKELQIILVDDGSTDSSGQICDRYGQIDDRIEVVHKDNGGLVSARKIGLAVADGEYIGFVDGDDYIDSDYYEHLVSAMIGEQVDIVCSGFVRENMRGELLGRICYKQKKYDIHKENIQFIENYVLSNSNADLIDISPSIWSKLFKAEMIKTAYNKVPDSQSYGEDYICLCAILLKCKSILLLNVTKYHYLIRPTSITNHVKEKKMLRGLHLYECLRDLFVKEDCYVQLESALDKNFDRYFLRVVKNIWSDRIIQYYYYRDMEKIRGKRVVIFGAGSVGCDYYAQICRYQDCSVVAVFDSKYESYHYDYVQVKSPEELAKIDYDYVIIAVLKQDIADEIKNQLVGLGVLSEKILWSEPCW